MLDILPAATPKNRTRLPPCWSRDGSPVMPHQHPNLTCESPIGRAQATRLNLSFWDCGDGCLASTCKGRIQCRKCWRRQYTDDLEQRQMIQHVILFPVPEDPGKYPLRQINQSPVVRRISLLNSPQNASLLQLIRCHYKQVALEKKLAYLSQSIPLSSSKSTSLYDQHWHWPWHKYCLILTSVLCIISA